MINNSQKIKLLILTTVLVFIVLGISILAIFSFVGKDKFVIRAQVPEAIEGGKTETVGGVMVRKPFAVTEDPCPADTDWREGEFRSEGVVDRDKYDFRDFPYIMWFDSNLFFINEISGERCLVEEHIMKKALRTPGHSDRVMLGGVSNPRIKNLSDNLIFAGGIPETGGGGVLLYSYNLNSKEFLLLEEANRYHSGGASPDGYRMTGMRIGDGGTLYIIDLQTDSVLTEVKLNEGETLIKGDGLGGPFMELNWVDDNTLEYTVFVFDESQNLGFPNYTGDPIETRQVKIAD